MAPVWVVGVVFLVSTMWLYWLSVNPPNGGNPEVNLSQTDIRNKTEVNFPTSFEELTALASLLKHYQTLHQNYVLLLFCSAYLYKQTFAIPGSVFLNVLAGALFGSFNGVILVCLLTAIGATFCYLLSYTFGYQYIKQYFPDKTHKLQQMINNNTHSLFFFLLFVRLLPMMPNWFLNLASPVLNIPLHLFFLSVFIGLMPYNFICVETGCILSEISSMEEIFTSWTLCKLTGTAIAILLPGLIVKKLKANQEISKSS